MCKESPLALVIAPEPIAGTPKAAAPESLSIEGGGPARARKTPGIALSVLIHACALILLVKGPAMFAMPGGGQGTLCLSLDGLGGAQSGGNGAMGDGGERPGEQAKAPAAPQAKQEATPSKTEETPPKAKPIDQKKALPVHKVAPEKKVRNKPKAPPRSKPSPSKEATPKQARQAPASPSLSPMQTASAPGSGLARGGQGAVGTQPGQSGQGRGNGTGTGQGASEAGTGHGQGDGGAAVAKADYLSRNYSYISKKIRRYLVYTEAAKRRGLDGTVVVAFAIGKDGSASKIRVKKSSGHAMLDEAATKAVQDASPFAPPPVEASIAVPIQFTLR